MRYSLLFLLLIGCDHSHRYARTPEKTVVVCKSEWHYCGWYLYDCNDGRTYSCVHGRSDYGPVRER